MEFVIGLLIVLLALFAAGYFFRKKIYAEIDRLESWKIEILNRSIVEEMSKIKHLKMTGQTEEFFEKWREEWDEIVTATCRKLKSSFMMPRKMQTNTGLKRPIKCSFISTTC